MSKRLLITGGAGFIGSHFVRHVLTNHSDIQVTNLDNLTYAVVANISDFEKHKNYRFVKGDIADPKIVDPLASEADIIVNFAAETHVDRSIEDPAIFIRSNVIGTQVLLDAARKYNHARYLQVSTDEVYGDRMEGFFKEDDRLRPSSPYAASKAAADLLVLAYHRTYGMPAVITRCSNNYGTSQFWEKLIPFFVRKLAAGEKVPLYGDGSNVRDWLHVFDHCKAIDLVLEKGNIGEVYNVSANEEHSNLEITKRMLNILNLPEDRIEFVKDRPGHDVRYAIDAFKLRALGWEPKEDFMSQFENTVKWYQGQFIAK